MVPRATSKAIYWLQAFLAVMVVAIHTGQDRPADEPLAYLVKFVNYGLTMPTLQCYFLLAGYLMFAGFDRFGWPEYRRTVTRRLATLVLPWLIWTFIGYFAWVIFAPERQAPPIWRIDQIFWAKDYSQPLQLWPGVEMPLLGTPFGDGVMYCIRDIFIAAVISPVIWWMVRGMRMWTVALMLVIFLFIGRPGIGPWHANWIFLPIGTALSICRFDLEKLTSILGWPLVALWIIMTAAAVWIVLHFDSNHVNHGLWTRLYMLATIFIGLLAYMVLAFKASKRQNSLMMTLVPFAFFIIAIHVLPFVEKPLLAAIGVSNNLLQIPSDWQALTEIFFMLPLRIMLIVGIATLIGQISPRLLQILTGARSNRKFTHHNDDPK